MNVTAFAGTDTITFWAKPPSRFEQIFWTGWVLLSVILVFGFSLRPVILPRLVVSVILTALFAGFWLATQRQVVLRTNYPALAVSAAGLTFWAGSGQEKSLSWQQLEDVSFGYDEGESWVAFDTINNRHLGDKIFGLFPSPITIPAKAKSKAGMRLDVWVEEHLVASGSQPT